MYLKFFLKHFYVSVKKKIQYEWTLLVFMVQSLIFSSKTNHETLFNSWEEALLSFILPKMPLVNKNCGNAGTLRTMTLGRTWSVVGQSVTCSLRGGSSTPWGPKRGRVGCRVSGPRSKSSRSASRVELPILPRRLRSCGPMFCSWTRVRNVAFSWRRLKSSSSVVDMNHIIWYLISHSK